MATKIYPATGAGSGRNGEDVSNDVDEFQGYMVSRDQMEEDMVKKNDKVQLDYLRLTLLQDQKTLAAISKDTDMRINRLLKFKAEACKRAVQSERLLQNREQINQRRIKNKIKKVSRDLLEDKRELHRRKQLLDIKREQARLLSNATKTRKLEKIDGRLRMIKAQNLMEDRELKPLVEIAKKAINEITQNAIVRMKSFISNEEFHKAQKLLDECSSASHAMESLTDNVQRGFEEIKLQINEKDNEKFRRLCDRLDEYVRSENIEQVQSLLKDIRIAGDHTNEIVKISVEKAKVFLSSYKTRLIQDLKITLGVQQHATMEIFGKKVDVETYKMSRFTYNTASDEYRFPPGESPVVGLFNGTDKEYGMENMQMSTDDRMKFVCRDVSGKPGTMAWRFNIADTTSQSMLFINRLKIMALSSKTQGSSITWELRGSASNTDEPIVVRANLLGSPSIIDFTQDAKGWTWFQIRASLDPGQDVKPKEEEFHGDEISNSDDILNAQLFRSRDEDTESSQFSIWIEVAAEANESEFAIDKEKLSDLIKKSEKSLGAKESQSHFLKYAKEKLL